ncbi:hypothetical protein [Rhodovulum adriaticum]|uniref:Metal binding Ada-like protein n=1 Tax=Rhodovulum adriaticum TaxID=35804 RepID=A0A4V2SM81_RHOAD|nr:hypothetical protein [Rhodovulum adriaticum]MBK1635647.1 hypothetical protein [Rhodovulum adriaticum]TCP26116.1 hypothetical protein EV656_10278 [Rhodovulum adriaticum]
MARQNRVTPTGDFIATEARGDFMGNRGILHDASGRLGRARWRHRAWVCCVLSYKEGRRALMAPGQYTELFFLDEAVALAAGHRPCARCRPDDFRRFLAAAGGVKCAGDLDAALHRARAIPRVRQQRRQTAQSGALPDGAFILHPLDRIPCLLMGDAALPYAPDGYGPPRPRPQGRVTVLTPQPSLTALHSGYRPALHRTAGV